MQTDKNILRSLQLTSLLRNFVCRKQAIIPMRKLYLVLITLLCCFDGKAQVQPSDSINFSLLTCSPGTKVYELFGHTAIRYENLSTGEDLVFNYGMFSFNTPHFAYRFVKGETDYQLGVIPYFYFRLEYAERGSTVYAQDLNLTTEEKQALLAFLQNNALPENATYRYNYFYDNCTTRARDAIEKAVRGKIVYPESDTLKSFRDIVHEYTAGYHWDEFGIDLCIGADADKPISGRLQMFAPFYTMNFMDKAYILSPKGEQRPLLTRKYTIVDTARIASTPSSFTPMWCMCLFLVLNLVVAWCQWRKKRIYKLYDLSIYGIQGLAGCVIAFLFFISTHPTVDSNWLILLFNPLPLLLIVWTHFFASPQSRKRYFVAKAVYLTLFIVAFGFIPQEISLSILPLAFGLWVNAVSHVLVYRE